MAGPGNAAQFIPHRSPRRKKNFTEMLKII
jgi:hypothetical protein